MTQKKATTHQILNGWKEIANYLGRGVRSVQRYERELGLPIHRPVGKFAGSVIATKAELDVWVAAGPTRVDLMKKRLHGQTNKVGVDFLQIDSEIALTFSGIALQTSDPEKKRRTIRVARTAYDTIMKLRKNLDFDQGGEQAGCQTPAAEKRASEPWRKLIVCSESHTRRRHGCHYQGVLTSLRRLFAKNQDQ